MPATNDPFMRLMHQAIEKKIAQMASNQAFLVNEMRAFPKDSYAFQRRNLGVEVMGLGIDILAHFLPKTTRDQILLRK